MDRKKFLISTSLLLISIKALKAQNLVSESFLSESLNVTSIQKLKKAAELRKKRLYNRSGSTRTRRSLLSFNTVNVDSITKLYDEVLSQDPSEIRAYNGKRKLLIQEGVSPKQINLLYQQGLLQNPDNPVFKERIAMQYLRLHQGNQKEVSQLPIPLNQKHLLLRESEKLLKEARFEDVGNTQYVKQLEKIDRLQNLNAFITDARDNDQLKRAKREAKVLQLELKPFSSSVDYKNNITYLQSKPYDANRALVISKIQKEYIKKLRDEKNYTLAVSEVINLYNNNKSDVDALALTRKILKKNNSFQDLEVIERDNDGLKKTFWSKLSFVDVLMKRQEIENQNRLSEIEQQLNIVRDKAVFPDQKFEADIRWLKFVCMKNGSTAKQDLLDFGNSLLGVSSAHMLDKYSRLCVKYYQDNNQNQQAIIAIGIILKNNTVPVEEDSLLLQLEELSRYRQVRSVKENRGLQNLKEKLINSGSYV
ncbi:hypothetical protein [Flavobacterium sp. NKUCC04_CG]|uniref:hypothetical protein n=1 Tax=Flavobacterium sp. NKUCC04_CG TaxID=2842121 RepID=UPI001C5AFD86|nr:hypothetical protein [Flavobacterium sp. NKUCC04_CG]MBW3518529.1 hypothetical protein [Flavobacterium sp. NKUCC04_CG]